MVFFGRRLQRRLASPWQMPKIRCPKQEPEMLKKRASQSWLRAVALKPRPHTLPLATPLLHYLATVRFGLWAQVVSFRNFRWSQLCATILVFFGITFSSLAGRSVLACGPHFVTIFGPSFGHRFWSLIWAPSCPQIRRLLMNLVFVAQFWHQIWSPKREPKTCNFLPRNPDTFQPNFEQNLAKIPKSWTREKHIANTQKDPNTCSKLAAQAGHHLPACAAYLQPGSATHTP